MDREQILALIRDNLRIDIETGGYMGRALDGVSPLWIDEPGRIQVTLKLDDEIISESRADLDLSAFFRRV